MAKPRLVKGYDYVQGKALERTIVGWRDEVAKAVAEGGYSKRIKGDLTAFAASGRMLFEVYDQDSPSSSPAEPRRLQ